MENREEEILKQEIQAMMAVEPETGSKNKKGRRRIKLCLVLAGAAAGIFLVKRFVLPSGPAPAKVETVALVRQPIEEKLVVSGPVSGTDSVDVVSNIHAEIVAMNVKEGDKVVQGQVLAELDRKGLEREVEIARNAYELALVNQQQKDKSEALGYEKAVQDLQKAQADYDRSSLLFGSGDISQSEMETAANALNDAKRAAEGYYVKNGRGAADPSYELQVENAAYELEKKQEELMNTQIKSTINGTVVRVNSKVGQFADKVEDNKPIFSIENLDQLEMELNISEYSIGKVQVGQSVTIRADILGGETVKGVVSKISPTGEEKGGGSTERVIPTTIQIEENDSRLIAGITARAEILIRSSQDALTVPVSALVEDETGTWLAVAENQKVRRIPVTTGIDGDVIVEVTPKEGYELTEGMAVIANPTPQMTDGTPVVLPEK